MVSFEMANKVDNGGTCLLFWLFVMVAGAGIGIFIYAKKQECAYVDAAKRIVNKAHALTLRLCCKSKSPLSDDDTSNESGADTMTEPDCLRFACPHCGQHFEADCEIVGMKVDCPQCGKSFTVPTVGAGGD